MQSVASLMSLGNKSDIGNIDEFDEEDEPRELSSGDVNKFSELAAKLASLDCDDDDSSLFTKIDHSEYSFLLYIHLQSPIPIVWNLEKSYYMVH